MIDQVADSLKYYTYFIFFFISMTMGSLDIAVLVGHSLNATNNVNKMPSCYWINILSCSGNQNKRKLFS
jgi:hypothetical protein